ncbi:uncharacterized protein DUF1018 [Zavarzinia compransoris]|nr:uncharacterized protein DUF1018 [Zavarzinia compransoris]
MSMIPKKSDPRRALLSKIHVEKSKRGIEDDDYRSAIGRIAPGRSSAADLTNPQLVRLVEWVTGVGQAVKTRATARERSPHQAKAAALWMTLWWLGATESPAEAALAKFIKRQVGVDAIDWWSAAETSPVIDALRSWCRREGLRLKPGVTAAEADALLVQAQAAKLMAMGVQPPDAGGRPASAAFETREVIRRQGDLIRAHKEKRV